MKTMQPPPAIGDKVFLPELGIYGEIVEFYEDNSQLITRVRAIVNGKPTVLDVTNLIVDIATAIKIALPLLQKAGRAIKTLCQKIGICKKPKPPIAAIPLAMVATIEALQARAKTMLPVDSYWANEAQIDALLAYYPTKP
jgi:hypothetical protein